MLMHWRHLASIRTGHHGFQPFLLGVVRGADSLCICRATFLHLALISSTPHYPESTRFEGSWSTRLKRAPSFFNFS